MELNITKYIDPFTDTGFKIIFGTEKQSEFILMGFLNTIFEGQPGFEKIKSVTYINPERNRQTQRGKTIIHDVMCRTIKGHRFIIEMQKGKKDDFLYRSTYYTCRGVTDQVTIGSEKKTKYNYLPIASVYVCNFNVRGLEKKLLSNFMWMDVETHALLTKDIRTAYIQLPQFNKKWEECENNFEKWIFLLKNMHKLKEFPEITRKDEVFSRLERVASYANMSEQERISYELDLKWASEYEEEIATAKREAAEEGRAEGRIEGRAEGIAEGRAEGELDQKWEDAKSFFECGVSLETISQATKLPIEELKEKLLK